MFKNLIANYLGRTWSSILAIALIPTYIRLMGIEAYGLVGFFTTITSVFGLLDFGIGATMTRELALRSSTSGKENTKRDLVRTLELIYWGLSLIAGVLIYFGSSIIANFWVNSESIALADIVFSIKLMGLGFAFQFPTSLYQGGLMGLERQVLVNVINITISTFRGGGAVLVLWFISPTITVFFQWQVISSVIGCLVFIVATWGSLPRSSKISRFNFTIVRDIWKYAAAISANAILGIFLTQLDKIILSKMLSLRTFGYYSIAATAASAIWLIIIPFSNSIFPRLVHLYEKRDYLQLRDFFRASSQWLSLVLYPVCAVVVVYSSEMLFLWMNDPILAQKSYLILSLLVFGIMLNGMVSLPGNCAPAFGWPLLMTYTNIFQVVLIVPLVIFLVLWLNIIGAGIAWIIINSVYVIFMAPIFFKKYLKEEKKGWYVNDNLLPFVISFCVCIVSRLIYPEFQSRILIFIWIFVTLTISFISTFLALKYTRSVFIKNLNKLY